jgi:hypothetical protein
MITSCVFLVALYEAGFSTPSAASESIPAETGASTNEKEYAPSWAFQLRTLQGHEQYFWRIVACLVPILTIVFIILVAYIYRRRVSYRDDKTKRKLPHPMKLLPKCENSMGEISALPLMQKLAERRGKCQKKVEPMKKIVNVEKERHDRFENEMDLMKKMMEVHYKRQDRFQNDMFGMKTMMKEEEKRHVQFLKQMDSMKAAMKAAQTHHAVLQYKADMTKKDDERLVQLMNGVDSVKRNGATQFS